MKNMNEKQLPEGVRQVRFNSTEQPRQGDSNDNNNNSSNENITNNRKISNNNNRITASTGKTPDSYPSDYTAKYSENNVTHPNKKNTISYALDYPPSEAASHISSNTTHFFRSETTGGPVN